MADSHSGQERTEQPSAKRLSEARDKGNVPRSRELTTMLLLMGAAGALYMSSSHVLTALTSIMRRDFVVDHAVLMNDEKLYWFFVQSAVDGLSCLLPFFVVVCIFALIGPLIIGGWSFSTEALGFNWERLDPIRGAGRLFSLGGLIEVVKALAKFGLVLVLGVVAFIVEYEPVALLGRTSVEQGLAQAGAICFKSFLIVASGTVFIVLFDVPYQLWDHARKLRMTRQDLKDEQKESDGSPEVKGRIRALQQELANRRMMEEVPKADVIVTNPDHYAVALRFDPETMAAPRVVAKGADHLAFRIRDLAREHQVVIVAAPPLARSIFHTTKLNHEIPAGLYVAVAQVLAYVFQLRRQATAVSGYRLPEDFPIPPELQF